jgi:uncharacterized protein (DUF885 family)
MAEIANSELQPTLTVLLDEAYEQRIQHDPWSAKRFDEPNHGFAFPDRISSARYPFPSNTEHRTILKNNSEQLLRDIGQLSTDGTVVTDEQRVATGVRMQLGLMENTDPLRPIDHSPWTPLTEVLADFGRSSYSEKDLAGIMECAHGFSEWADHAVDAMQEGKQRKDVQPATVIEATLTQLRTLIGGRLHELCMAPLGKAITDVPESLKSSYSDSIKKDMLDSYSRMESYLREEYAPYCRDDARPGLCHLPDGRSQYERLLAYTCADESATPEGVYSQAEARYHAAEKDLRKIAYNNGFTVAGLMQYLKSASVFQISSAGQLQKQFEQRLRQLGEYLPALFHEQDIPKDQCEVHLLETQASLATYENNGTQGRITLPDTKLSSFTVNDISRIAAHEGVPGHHLQLTRQLGGTGTHAYLDHFVPVPIFREGWAMYAESLPGEMGIPLNDFERAALLSAELSIARGVMLDVALHHNGISVRDARAMRAAMHGYETDDAAQADVLRFIGWPGQVLSYTGGFVMKDYRRFAQRSLGSLFDARDFHGFILQTGEMPLPLLGKLLGQWVTSRNTQGI